MKLMVIAPGHSYSTKDVFDGMCAGLRAAGVAVIAYDSYRYLRILNTMAATLAQAQNLPKAEADALQRFALFLSGCDAVNVALDQQVDGVIVINGLLFAPERARLMHDRLGIPVACYGTEAPYLDVQERAMAPYYSHWFTNEQRSVATFAALTKACYLPHAWNPEAHTVQPANPAYTCDVSFVGGGFPERKALFAGVDWTGIDLQLRGTLWRDATNLSAGAIPNTETIQWHRNSAIAVNSHRTMTTIEAQGVIPDGSAASLGPRAYEIPAVGGFLLCDDSRPELFDVYGESAAAFRAGDVADFAQQVRYWLAHPEARERRRRAQFAAVQAHSWTQRVPIILNHLFS